MKKRTDKKNAGTLRELARRALVVLLTVSMVSMNSPLAYAAETGAMEKSEPAQAELAKAETTQSVEPKAEAEVEVAEPAATEPAQAAPAQTDTTEQLEATEPSSKQEETNDTKNSDATVEIVGTKSDASQGEVDVKLSFTHAYIHYNGQSIGLPTKSVTVPADQEFRFVAVADEGFVLKQVTMTRNGAETALEADADGTFVVPAADVVTGLTVSVEAEGDPFVTSPTTKPIEEKRNEKSTFEYEDADVKVTATLTDPAALPADVTFKVTPITRDSKDAQGNPTYNYDAYMEALNKSVGETNRYTPENTLLYDVGFFTVKKDESGSPVAGEQVEVQLEEGLVQLDFQFKKNQLSSEIKATDSSNIQIEHLPLRDSVRSAVDSTAAASNISADDIIVEAPKDQNANVGSEQMSLKLDSLSGIAAANLTPQTTQGQSAQAEPVQAEPAQVEQTQGKTVAGNQANGGASDASTTQTENTNLADFLTYAYFGAQQNENGQYVVRPGEGYKIMLTFAERYDFQFPNSDATMRYKLPEGLESADGHDGTFTITIDDRGTSYAVEGNHYDIREITNASGKKELWLEVQFNKNSPNFRKLTSVADAAFTLSFWGTVKEDATELLFKDGINKVLNVDTSHSVKVSKSASQSNDSNEMNYTVAVRSTGKSTNVQVSDVLTCATDGLLTLDANSFQITSSKSDHNVSGLTPTISGNNFSYVIPEMSDGELITIRYKATIHPETIMPNAEHKYVSTSNNRVEVWSDGDTTKKDEQSVNNTIDYTPTVSKASGAVTCGENNKQTISWTINANPKCAISMANTPITDSIAEGSRDIMKYSGNGLTIVVKDANGNEVRTDNVPWGDLQSHSDATWTYVVPEGDAGHAYSYTITYTTEVDMTGKVTTTTVNNTVTTGGSSGSSGTGVTPAGGEINVSKQATKVDLTNGTVSWRVTFNVPAAGLDSAEVVDNYLSAWVDNVKLVEKILPDTVDVIGLIGEESYQKIPDDALGKLTIKFFKTGDQSAGNEGLQSSPTDRIIYVDFKTEINESWVNASTRGEAFTYLQNHTNTVWFNANGGSKSAQGTASVVPGMEKSGDIVGYRTDANGVKLPVYKYELVIANVSTNSVEVSDKFDTSILSYYTGTEGIDNEWYQGYVFGGSIYSQDNRGEKFAYVETTDGITMTTSTLPHNGNDFYPKYKFVYYLTVKDANALQTIKERAVAEGGVYKIHNSASYGKQSTGTDIEYKYEGLKKKLLTSDQELINNPKIHPKFEITLNSGGMVLNDGNPLTVKDTVSSSLSVDLDSIRAEPSNGVTWDMSGNTVTYTIPDATPVTITYTASIILSEALELGQTRTISFSNEAEMLGYSDKVEGSVTRANNGEGTGSSVAIRIMKYKAGDMTKRLSGAKFELQNEDGTPVTKRDGSPLPYFVSGIDGMIEIYGNSETDNWSLQKDKTYLLEEKEAPAGYTIVAGKDNGAGKDTRYRFTISSNGVTDYANRIYPSNDILTVKNWPGTDVRVLKEWTDGKDHNETVVVKLQQKREDSDSFTNTIRRETETGGWEDADNVTIELKNDNNWEGYFYKLPTVVPKEINDPDGEDVSVEYQVVEVSVNGEAPAEGTVEVLNETAPNSGTYVYRIKNGVQEEKGNLTVKKTVDSADAADADKTFVFTVTLYDANGNVDTSINGTKGDMTFENGVATVDIKKDEEKTAIDLPIGTKYTVTETEESKEGFVATGEVVASNKGEISANTPLVTINNAKEQTGAITVEKAVESAATADHSTKFTFTITFSDDTLSGTYGGVRFDQGVGTVELADGEHATIDGLPLGLTYTVAEADAPGFSRTGEVLETAEASTRTVTAEGATVHITNTRDKGSLKVHKQVTSTNAADLNKDFNFRVTITNDNQFAGEYDNMTFEGGVARFSLKNDQTAVATNLPVGLEYKVEEEVASGFVTTSTGDTGAISKNTESVAEFTNSRIEGDLLVSKTVDSKLPSDANKEFSFTVTLKKDGKKADISGTFDQMEFTDGVATFKLKDGDTKSAKGLPEGIEYTVEETSEEGFTTTHEGNTTGTIQNSGTANVAFTNKRKTGGLSVKKQVTSDVSSDKTKDYSFKVTLGEQITGSFGDMDFVDGVATFALKDNESLTASDLPVGLHYTVEEEGVPTIFDVTKDGDDGNIASGTTQATITNTRKTGELKVEKTVTSDAAADQTKVFEFEIDLHDATINKTFSEVEFTGGKATISVTAGQSKTIKGLPVGLNYTVTETSDDGFTMTSEGTTGAISQEPSTATFTNTRNTGGFSVKKVVNSSMPADKRTKFSFKVTLSDTTINTTDEKSYGQMRFTNGEATFELANNETVTAENLPIGITYTVEETTNSAYTTTSTGNITNQQITNVAQEVVFTNTKKEGGLTVAKSVTSPLAADKAAKYEIKVTLTDNTVNGTYGNMTFENGVATLEMKDGDTATATGLADGVGYTVSEKHYDNFETTYEGQTSGTISSDPDVTNQVTVTNTRETGKLEVTKTVVSDAAADKTANFEFTVKLNANVNGEYNGVTFANGTGTFTLTDDGTKTIEGLPAGVDYEVTEKSDEGYATSWNGNTGTVATGTIATTKKTAAFTNTRKTGELEVTKVVDSKKASDARAKYPIKVTLSDTTINTTNNKIYGDMEFKNGVAEFELGANDTLKASNLPYGITYTVEETLPIGQDDYVVTITGNTGTIGQTTSTAVVTNKRTTGSLTVSKSLFSEAADDNGRSFEFTIELDDTSITGTYGDVKFTNGVAVVNVPGNGSLTARGLPTDVGYTITETASGNYVQGKTTEGSGTISQAGITEVFTNERKTGEFDVTKHVTSSTASDKQIEFNFTATLSDTTISGLHGDMTFENGVARFTLHDGETKAAKNLPVGVNYTVEETAADGFVLSNVSGKTGTVSATETPEASFTNAKSEGGLVVSKSVDSAVGADHTKDYSFTVELGDKTVNGTYGDMEFTDGVATFTLKDAEHKTATGLANGMAYTVTETADNDFTTSYVSKTAGAEDVATNEGVIETNATKVVEFTNTRKTGNLKVSKELVSKKTADKDQTFTFTVKLKGADGNADESINGTFSNITFEKGVGTVTLKGGAEKLIEGLPANVNYEVTEEETGNENIVLSDSTNATGTIAADAVIEAHFKNERKTGKLKVKKVVENGTTSDGTAPFNFTVQLNDTGVNGDFSGLTFTNGATSFTLTNGEEKTIEGLPTEVGYTVTETGLDTNNFTATWSDNTTGTIERDATKEVTCTNERQYGSLAFKKIVQVDGAATSGTAADGTYHFKVTGPNGYSVEPTIEIKNGKMLTNEVKLINLVAGEYTVQEITDRLPSNMKLIGEKSRKVNVTANNEANVPTETFVNNLTTLQANLEVTKQFVNWDNVTWPEGAKNGFDFKLTPASIDDPMPEEGTLEGAQIRTATKTKPTAEFGDITFTKDGTYTYHIQEVVPTGANAENVYRGIAYDDKVYTVTVVVATNDDGKLGYTVKYDNSTDPLTVTNTYDAMGKIRIEGTKELTGRSLQQDDKWSFTISGEPGAPMPSQTTVKNVGGTIDFGEIDFGLGDVREYPYVYTITESGNVNDVVNDAAATKTVEVRVSNNGDGTLKVEADETDGSYFTFTNNYQVEEPLEAVKGIVGRENNEWRRNENGQIAEDYTFELVAPSDNDPAVTEASLKKLQSSFGLSDNKTSITATTQGEEHKASFGAFKFTAADVGKIFKYTVREVLPKNESGQTVDSKDGVTYSKVQYDIIYTPYLDQNDNNKLKVRHEYMHGETEAEAIRFENTYAPADTSVTIQAKKRLQGGQITDGEFSFDLYYVNPQTGDKTLEQGKTKPASHADGDVYNDQTKTDVASVTFDAITCSKAGTETYVIKEVIPEGAVKKKDANGVEHWYKDGITYDDSEQRVKIKTVDDQMGHLSATVEYLDKGTESLPTFNNTYFGATANIEFDKAYYGKDPNATFGFTMVAAADETYTAREGGAPTYEEAFVDSNQPLRAKAQNPTFVNGVATVKMPTITYHEAGTYYYTITEDAQSGNADVQTDTAAIRVKVVVGDDANATVTYALYDGDAASEFTNQRQTLYNNANLVLGFRSAALRAMAQAASFTNFEPAVRKVLKNGVLKGGEFEFAIYEGEKAEGNALKIVPNDENGKVSFGDFTYGPSDVGPHTYTIVELAGDDETVVYDADPIKLTVDVKLNASGAVEATGTYDQKTDAGVYAKTDDPTFVNEYDTIIIHAVKRSREEPYDPLPGAHYGLWMVNPNGEDVYMGLGRNQQQREGSELVSSDNGDLYYDIPLLEGVAYYFLEEWPPPAGHLVDPYPTDYFTLVHDKENGKFRLVYEADSDFAKYCPDVHR